VSARGEPTGQPISALSTIAMLTDDGLRDAQAHYETLLQARPKPYLLDDATIARVRRGNAEGLEYCDVTAMKQETE
jgi:hypothetical protein